MNPSAPNASGIELNHQIWNREYIAAQGKLPGYEPFLEVIHHLIEQNGYRRILDYGCGSGIVGHHLRSVAPLPALTLTGIDIAPEALPLCKPYYDHLHLGEGTKLPPGGPWDFVVFNSVLEHMDPPVLETILNQTAAQLAPGGALFVVVPNSYSPRRLLKGRRGEIEKERHELGHITMPGYGGWKAILQHHGFHSLTRGFGFRPYRHMGRLKQDISRGVPLRSLIYTALTARPFCRLRDSHWIYGKAPHTK